jgi:diguanylate cyclase (GGDEF)-like protein
MPPVTRRQAFLVASALVLLAGTADYLTGSELNFSAFYLAPVFIFTWVGGRSAGIAASVLCATLDVVTDWATGKTYSRDFFHYWDGVTDFVIFTSAALTVATLHRLLVSEAALARADPLTGLSNRRDFTDRLGHELARCVRHSRPVTVAYFDCDNFKHVNDTSGHHAGDLVLRSVATTLRETLRLTDVPARMGGDEFAVMLSETDAESAATVLAEVRARLLAAMNAGGWPVTFSIGAVTFRPVAGLGADDVLRRADALMYAVKRQGKDQVRFESAD